MSKPREFWISDTGAEDYISHGPAENCMHVIEYSAYEAVCKRLEETTTLMLEQAGMNPDTSSIKQERDNLKTEQQKLAKHFTDKIGGMRDEAELELHKLRAELEEAKLANSDAQNNWNKLMALDADYRKLKADMAIAVESLEEAYMSLADCASRVKAPEPYMFEVIKKALTRLGARK